MAEAAPKTCPHSKSSRSETAPNLGRLNDDVRMIFARRVEPQHPPYYPMRRGHLDRMNNALKDISNAGASVEAGVLKAKTLLHQGENPDLIRHALGIYLTHSRDAQARALVVPSAKFHASFLSRPSPKVLATSAAAPSIQQLTPGAVITGDTFAGPALLSYWREDYDYNDHHIHWHMVYPGTGIVVDGVNVAVIDRQGELFLYMHSQMVARYDTEGLCWNLPLVRPWNQYDDVLEFGYVPVPGLAETYGGYPPMSSWYAVRNPHIPDAPDAPVPRETLETWRDNIYQAIKDGFFHTVHQATGAPGKVMLTPENAATLVGIVVESESDALQVLPDGYMLNREMYGNLHNFGHDKFAEIGFHNYISPTNPLGLMISNFGSPRDSAFWPWHKHIQYFGRLVGAKYPQDIGEHAALVTLSDLVIAPVDPAAPRAAEGGITTWLGPPALHLLELNAKLDHEPYQWSVTVTSRRTPPPSPDNPQKLTLRFFIVAEELTEDYHSWLEMDKITVDLDSPTKTVQRKDTDSSVARKMKSYSEDDNDPTTTSWCRCGWPQNMMLPAGKVEGMRFVAFCIATDDSTASPLKTPAQSYCGSMQNERKYPDPRPMGYPFNAVWKQQIQDPAKRALRDIIKDHKALPFTAVGNFKIFRTTKLIPDFPTPPPPPVEITWENTIKNFFLPGDVLCMKEEYGYDLSKVEDVTLHAGAIYDATSNKRMPLQMAPYTQANPDPNHPLWTDEMCAKFRAWMLNGCPVGKPTPPPPPPHTDVTWDNTIKNYFLPSDVACMKSQFDLSKKADVAANAAAIYDATSTKRMPLQMAPYTQTNPDPNHPLWTDEMCAKFKSWMDGGCP